MNAREDETKDDIRPGTMVRSRNGEKVGKVLRCGPESFVIEKGFFFKRDYEARYSDIIGENDGEVILGLSKDELYRVGGLARTGATSRDAVLIGVTSPSEPDAGAVGKTDGADAAAIADTGFSDEDEDDATPVTDEDILFVEAITDAPEPITDEAEDEPPHPPAARL